MDLHRLRPADWLTGVAGVALIVLLWAPWYGVGNGTLSGWQAFGVVDLWLVLTAALAIGVWVMTAVRESPALPVVMDVLCATASVIAMLLVLFRVLDEPHGDVVTGREWGLWAGALATLGVLVGSWWAMRDESGPGLRQPAEIRTLPVPPPVSAESEPTSRET